MRTILIVALLAQAQQPPWEPKNLRYFPKDITREALVQRMREFSFALNVRCQYCHTGGDGISFDTQADAFIAGLRAEPDHPLLLAHLALLHAIDPDAYPALPSGACQALTDRLEREPTQSPGVSQRELDEHRAYVCAHAALAAGDHEAAARHFAASSSRYPDRRLRQIEALVALGRKREARALAAEARRDIEPVAVDRGFGAGDEQAVWKKQLAAALRR